MSSEGMPRWLILPVVCAVLVSFVAGAAAGNLGTIYCLHRVNEGAGTVCFGMAMEAEEQGNRMQAIELLVKAELLLPDISSGPRYNVFGLDAHSIDLEIGRIYLDCGCLEMADVHLREAEAAFPPERADEERGMATDRRILKDLLERLRTEKEKVRQ